MKQTSMGPWFAIGAAFLLLGQGCLKAPPLPPSDDSGSVSREQPVLDATGAPPRLLEYNKTDFDAALASDTLIVLYFYANWCPICRLEFPKMQKAFEELSDDDVIGFRVSFNDNETTVEEEALAREHGVAYQHTKVFIKNGARILKSPEGWDKDRYIQEINKARNP